MDLSNNGYALMLASAIAITVPFWLRMARIDKRLIFIYLSAFIGAFLGAKLVYIGAEGWTYYGENSGKGSPTGGKSVLGAFLGGYLTVELTKFLLKYRNPTGDLFATVVPLAIILGRIGCHQAGCCLGITCEPAWYTIQDSNGVERWPSISFEIIFNLLCILTFYAFRKHRVLTGQHFHIYLIAYGAFRKR